MNPDPAAVEGYLRQLQDRICAALENVDGQARFQRDPWRREAGEGELSGGGETRVLSGGAVFERAGVAFSDVRGTRLPPSATAHRPELAGRGYRAIGVSLVIHPLNPHVPTSHANVRFFIAEAVPGSGTPNAQQGKGAAPVWWFGGGFDLTPYYGYEEDCRHWHGQARAACEGFTDEAGEPVFPRLKKWCDDYFVLKHRNEPRGIGGLFFDDWSSGGFERAFSLMRSVGDHYLPAYLPIVQRRQDIAYGERERDWQLYRRGRYVEFNLVWDRGTLFGLQSGGRTESILMSMPPLAAWQYDRRPEPGSPEAALGEHYLRPRDW